MKITSSTRGSCRGREGGREGGETGMQGQGGRVGGSCDLTRSSMKLHAGQAVTRPQVAPHCPPGYPPHPSAMPPHPHPTYHHGLPSPPSHPTHSMEEGEGGATPRPPHLPDREMVSTRSPLRLPAGTSTLSESPSPSQRAPSLLRASKEALFPSIARSPVPSIPPLYPRPLHRPRARRSARIRRRHAPAWGGGCGAARSPCEESIMSLCTGCGRRRAWRM